MIFFFVAIVDPKNMHSLSFFLSLSLTLQSSVWEKLCAIILPFLAFFFSFHLPFDIGISKWEQRAQMAASPFQKEIKATFGNKCHFCLICSNPLSDVVFSCTFFTWHIHSLSRPRSMSRILVRLILS